MLAHKGKMAQLTESAVEEACLDWLESLGYEQLFGPDISPSDDQAGVERGSFEDVLLECRTLAAIHNALLPKPIFGEARVRYAEKLLEGVA